MLVVSNDICDENGVGKTVMCPSCNHLCDYEYLWKTCFNSKLTYVFDNDSTVFFAIFMGIWGDKNEDRILNTKIAFITSEFLFF